MMRRYIPGPVDAEDVGVRSSQSLRNSDPPSSQLENSQCSSFDMFSQIMSQQQGYNSQPSESSQAAQRYYTKFSAKPSLFRGSGGREVIPVEKPGLSRRKSFQDVQEYQKHRTRDKEDRDLICTLIGLLKDSTDEVKQVVGRMQNDIHQQIEAASSNTDKAINKTYRCFEECSKQLVQEVLDKVTVMQSTTELEKKLIEKESILATLSSELEKTRDDKYAQLKSMLVDTTAEQHQNICGKVEEIFLKACDGQEFKQKKSLEEFSQSILTTIEEKMEKLATDVAESSAALSKKAVEEVAAVNSNKVSESENIPASSQQVTTAPVTATGIQPKPMSVSCQPHTAAPQISQPYLATLPSQAGMVTLPSHPAVTSILSRPNLPVFPDRPTPSTLPSYPQTYSRASTVSGYGAVPSTRPNPVMPPYVPLADPGHMGPPEISHMAVSLPNHQGSYPVASFAANNFTSHTKPTNFTQRVQQHVMEFGSPPIGQNMAGTSNMHDPFARWGAKGPSPVAAVAPRVHSSAYQSNIPRGSRAGDQSRNHSGRLQEQHDSYQPPQRRSARLKQKYVDGKLTMTPSNQYCRGQQRQKRYSESIPPKATKPKPKIAKRDNPYQTMKHNQSRPWKRGEVYDFSDEEENTAPFHPQSSKKQDYRSSRNSSSNAESFGQVFGRRPLQTYTRVVTGNQNMVHEGLQTVPQNDIDYESVSGDSSSDETFFSAEKQTQDVCSQDIFIDAVEQPVTSDDENEFHFPPMHRNEPEATRKARATNQIHQQHQQRPRAVEKRRTLWGSSSPKNRDLLSLLVGSIKKKTRVA